MAAPPNATNSTYSPLLVDIGTAEQNTATLATRLFGAGVITALTAFSLTANIMLFTVFIMVDSPV